jgi:hypothetical protein
MPSGVGRGKQPYPRAHLHTLGDAILIENHLSFQSVPLMVAGVSHLIRERVLNIVSLLRLLYHVLKLMIRYILSGFELELFSIHEYPYLYW